MKAQRRRIWFVRLTADLGILLALVAVVPALAATHIPAREVVGKCFFVDNIVNVAGGALLCNDCTHDGGLLAAPPFGPPSTQRLVPTYWVDNPDPTIEPYSLRPVPEVLQDRPRLFLCYDVEPVSGTPPPFNEFCDWASRDERAPLEIDTNGDGVRDLLIAARPAAVCAVRR